MSTFLDDPISERTDDELSTASVVGTEHDVHDGDRRIGQVARVRIAGHGTRWMARDAHHARYGDIPGQITGWCGRFDTKAEAIQALRDAVATRRAS